MTCPITGFDCITCEDTCLLKARREHADPFRRGNELRTCDDELRQIGLEPAAVEPKGKQQMNATLSDCGTYRYWLNRHWGEGTAVVNFIMLNPSTADHKEDDPTIRRCINFAKLWGYDGLEVTNLFAFRATDPKELKTAADPIGPLNDQHIEDTARKAELVICGWGTHGGLNNRQAHVMKLLSGISLGALKQTKAGFPGHPLYLKSSSKPQPFRRKA